MATRYIKHYYVDYPDTSKYLTDTNFGTEGKTIPNIPGLDIKFWGLDSNGIDYCLAIIEDDMVEIEEGPGISVISFEEWADLAEEQFNAFLREHDLVGQNVLFDRTSVKTMQDSLLAAYQALDNRSPAN